MWDEKIYGMKLGEIKQNMPNNSSAERLLRVPGGWVYTYTDMHGTTSTFIKYDLEYLPLTKRDKS
jgi:hypothetical protein